MKALLFGLIFAMTLSLGGNTLFAAKEVNYAFVDVAKVFDNYEKTKENDRVLQEEGKKKEEERDAMVLEIRQIKDEMILLSDESKVKKQKDIAEKMKSLQAFDENTRGLLGEKRNEVVKEIFKDIDDVIQRYGEKKGVDLIFNERALLYHDAQHDVTQQVIDDLNKGYKKR